MITPFLKLKSLKDKKFIRNVLAGNRIHKQHSFYMGRMDGWSDERDGNNNPIPQLTTHKPFNQKTIDN